MNSMLTPNKKRTDVLASCLGIILLPVLFQFLRVLRGDLLVLPELSKILNTFFRLLSKEKTWLLICTTFIDVLVSLLLSMLTGIILGLLEGLSGFLRSMLKPLMVLMRTIPMIVLMILIMVLFPYRKYLFVPVISATLILIPLISEAVAEGIRSIDKEYLDVYRLNSAFNIRVLFSVHLPMIRGFLQQSFVNAAGMAFKIAITAEYLVQSANSLGKAVYMSAYFSEYEEIYAYALLVVLLVLLLTAIPETIIRIKAKALKKQNTHLKIIA